MDKINESEEISKTRKLNRIAVIVILIVLLTAYAILTTPARMYDKRIRTESHCKLVLEELAVAQHRHNTITEGGFARLEELIEKGFFGDGYNTGNIIPHYELALFDVSSHGTDESFIGDIITSFTIVAIPDTTLSRLRTFAVNEKRVIYMWKGDDLKFSLTDVKLSDEEEWQEIREMDD